MIVGGTAGGISVAVSSLRLSLGLVRVLDARNAVSFPDLAADNQLDIGYGETVSAISAEGDLLRVTTNRQTYLTTACLVAERHTAPDWSPETGSDNDRIHIDHVPVAVEDQDVLVVGHTDHSVELTSTLAAAGARVVHAAGGMDPRLLSPAADHMLRRLERERRATLLYRSVPASFDDIDGYPMADFGDRRVPDLQFDRVVFTSPRSTYAPADVGATEEAVASGRLWFLGEPTEDSPPNTAPGHSVGIEMANALFPEAAVEEKTTVISKRTRHEGVIEELCDENYNAVITHFEPTHSDLWVLRVKPDEGDTSYLPGQYATLGLGYWEERIDDAIDIDIDDKWDKLIRRSYSISSRMFDEHGYLTDENGLDELEFYIVLVAPTEDNVPALTPRLALKRPGDRIYLGPKVAGRYTLASVVNPSDTIVFLSTGTGEAPHNGMVVDLLRKGHHGPIASAVSVRQWADLGYMDQHRELEKRYPNYKYFPSPTRESDIKKRYMQDFITEGVFETELGLDLNPDTTHVFLCGNPSMIGLPEEGENGPEFPETVGVVQLLTERGFTLDKRKSPGNIHYEEYW